MNKFDVLTEAPLFEGISIKETLPLLSRLKAAEKKYETGDTLIALGDAVPGVGIVLSGSIIIERGPKKAPFVIGELAPGDLLGAAEAGARCEKCPIRAVAGTESAVLWLSMERLLEDADNKPQTRVLANLLKIISKECLQNASKTDILSRRTTREKLMAYLREQSSMQGKKRFIIPLNRVNLAKYLAVDRSAMTRELSMMKKEGLIEFRLNTFELL